MNYNIGDIVQLKSNPDKKGRILEIIEEYGNISCLVDFGVDKSFISINSLRPYVKAEGVIDNFVAGNIYGFDEFQRKMTSLRLENSSTLDNNLFAINTSKTIFYEYQFKPLIKFIRSFRRSLLICDEVGLGKTIEAGLILKELQARNELRNTLVVVPSNLKIKWYQELKHRFSMNFQIIDNSREIIKLLENSYASRDDKHFLIISIDTLKNDRVIEAFEERDIRWSMLIVDEAHSLRNKNKRHDAVKRMSEMSLAMVFLTATPVQLDDRELFNVLNILDERQFDNYFAYSRQIADNKPIVRALNAISQIPPDFEECFKNVIELGFKFHELPAYQSLKELVSQTCVEIKLNPDKLVNISDKIITIQRYLNDLHLISPIFNRTLKKNVHIDRPKRCVYTVKCDFSDAEMDIYNGFIKSLSKEDYSGLGFVLCNTKRMLSSSLHAHIDSLQTKQLERLEQLSSEDLFFLDDEDLDLATQPISSVEGVKDSKLEKLHATIDELTATSKRKIIIFAFYRKTIQYIHESLSAKGVKCFLVHGNVPVEERPVIIDQFKKYDADSSVLIYSRVGSEGLDLQFCDTIINYDLPWNPMELEQRIGRIDRIAQKAKKIHIYNFGMESTIDDRIIMRLYDRIENFQDLIGPLEPIMGDIIKDVSSALFTNKAEEEEYENKILSKALVEQSKKYTAKDIEEANADLLSLDYFFENEIREIKSKRRYISERHLYTFIRGFLNENYESSRIRYSFSDNRGTIELCKQSRMNFRAIMPEENALNPFSYGPVSFTLDSETAMNEEGLTFINILHPLVQCIVSQCFGEKSVSNTHSFDLSRDILLEEGIDLPNGAYLYFVYLGKVSAGDEKTIIVPVIINSKLEVIGGLDECEKVLGIALESGRRMALNINIRDPKIINQAYDVSKEHYTKWFFDYFNQYKSRFLTVLQNKKDSLIYRFTRRIDAAKKAIDTLEAQEKDQSKMISLHRSRIEKNEKALFLELERLEQDGTPTYDYGDAAVCGGVFRVI